SLGEGKVGRSVYSSRRIEGKVLVPGCGAGHDVRLLAGQGAEVTGLDLAPGALKKAESFSKAASESYLLGDFLNLEKKHYRSYDWVFEHTCLCAIEPAEREAYVASLISALKPGGHFLAIFYREVPNYTEDGPPHPISEQEINELFGENFEVIDSYVPKQCYPSRPVGSEIVSWMSKR
ncbi:MAG: methyltransferase domain-containing protein, partial [Opitutales bacterium]